MIILKNKNLSKKQLLKKRSNIKQIEKSIIKMEYYKISKVLNDSSVSKFKTKRWVKLNDLSSGEYSVNKNIRLNFNVKIKIM